MAENKVTTREVKDKEPVDSGSILQLHKEYEFEGEKVSSIDFSGAYDITAQDMMRIDRIVTTQGNVSGYIESTLAYALAFAAECTKYPHEFYQRLCPNDAIRVKNRVQVFLNGLE